MTFKQQAVAVLAAFPGSSYMTGQQVAQVTVYPAAASWVTAGPCSGQLDNNRICSCQLAANQRDLGTGAAATAGAIIVSYYSYYRCGL